MKKIYLFAACLLMTAMNINAQTDDHKQEVAISFGAWSNSDILNTFEIVGSALVNATMDNDRYFGSLSAEYFYHLKPWIGVGGIAAYGQMKEDVYLTGKKNGKDGEISNSYVTLMPAVKFDWLRRNHFGMYSKLAIGATLRTEKWEDDTDSEFHVNWQVSLLGIEAGGTQLRGFMELGTGEQGIMLAGIRYKF